jgi:hypothetical protein
LAAAVVCGVRAVAGRQLYRGVDRQQAGGSEGVCRVWCVRVWSADNTEGQTPVCGACRYVRVRGWIVCYDWAIPLGGYTCVCGRRRLRRPGGAPSQHADSSAFVFRLKWCEWAVLLCEVQRFSDVVV